MGNPIPTGGKNDRSKPNLKIVDGKPPAPRRLAWKRPEDLPIITILLLLVNIALFAIMFKAGHGDVGRVADAFGAKDNDLIRNGQIWRFLTPIFLHGSLFHLISNSVSLLWLGTQMELIYGARKYFLIYMVAGIAGFLASFYRSNIPSLGASGAIFGFVGAGLVFPLRFRALIPEKTRTQILTQLLIVGAANLAIGFSTPRVDNWAHMGGLIGGGFMALFLLPNALDERPRRTLREVGLWASVLGMAVLVVWAAAAQYRAPRAPLPPTLPPLVYYGPVETRSWWNVGVPADWKRVGKGWQSPDGAILEIYDSLQAPQQTLTIAQLIHNLGPAAQDIHIGKLPGKRVVLTNPQVVFEATVLIAYNQAIVISMQCPSKAYPRTQAAAQRILYSVRVLQPPPVPPARKAPDKAAPAGQEPPSTPDASAIPGSAKSRTGMPPTAANGNPGAKSAVPSEANSPAGR